MESFLTFILILLIVFYLLRLALRYIVPWMITRFVKKQQDKFNNQSGFSGNNYDESKKGKVKIKKNKTKNTKDDGDFGEYVDFEEIE